jgi:hypothetical protein
MSIVCTYANCFLNCLAALLWRKYKFKFLLASMKTLALKILTETLFKMVVAAFKKLPVILNSNTLTLLKND